VRVVRQALYHGDDVSLLRVPLPDDLFRMSLPKYVCRNEREEGVKIIGAIGILGLMSVVALFIDAYGFGFRPHAPWPYQAGHYALWMLVGIFWVKWTR
jgi:hypothetical protein